MAGGLFRTRLEKAFDSRTAAFHTSVVDDLRIVEDDIDGTEAHDIMLHEQGVISRDALRQILTSLEAVRKEWLENRMEVSPEFEDIHEYIEAKVIDKIGIKTGGMIHTGRSRNDQVAVDMRRRVREELLSIAGATLRLAEALMQKAEQHTETLMLLYTHGQHAQVGTFAHYLGAYAEPLLRDFDRCLECYVRVNLNPLGSGPVGGTTIRVDRQRTTELLGFGGIAENSIDATSGRDWAVEVAAVTSILMSNLSRMAADLIEWSTKEFGYVELADQYSSSSSIMPQKKNPSTLELIRGKTGEVYGALTELLTMVKGLPNGYYQDLQGTKPPLWRSLDTTQASLDVMTGIINTLKVNDSRMLQMLDGSLTVAVDLVERLVEERNLSFRESYALVAAIVRDGIAKGIRFQDYSPEDAEILSEKILGRRLELESDLLSSSTNPLSSVAHRGSRGGPNPEEARRSIARQKNQIMKNKRILEEKEAFVQASKEILKKTVESYLYA